MSIKREVWKLGGSVLKDPADYEQFADHILKRAVDPGLDRLYVVVSAAKGVSESLIDSLPVTAKELDDIRTRLHSEEESDVQSLSISECDIAALLLWGEIDSCHRLRSALLKRGGRAKTVTQLDYYPIIAKDSRLCAAADSDASAERFHTFDKICADRKIVIVAGFGAVDQRGEPALLGRDSTDYVAALLTQLDRYVDRALFFKGSGGLYADFASPERQLIENIDAAHVRLYDRGGFLDKRCLDAIACNFQIVGSDLAVGTKVRCRPRRAAS